jgi:hypothetical protein
MVRITSQLSPQIILLVSICVLLKTNSIALASQFLYFPVLHHKQIENFPDQPFLCVFAQWHHYETLANLKIQDLRNVNSLSRFVNYAPLACAVASVFDNA